tara:strand:+ start:972 stop:1124 length:153 start_codon:yes stop_codon:yes gene_type:complete
MIDVYESILGSIGEATFYYFYDLSETVKNYRVLNKNPNQFLTIELSYDVK